MLSNLFRLTSVLFVLTQHATGQNNFVAQASGSTNINNVGGGKGVIGLALTLDGSAGADTPVSTLSTTTTSADTPASTLPPTTFPTTSAAASIATFSTNTVSTVSSDLGLESSTSDGFTPVTATAPPIFEGTATTRPFPVSLPTSEQASVTTEQASKVLTGSGLLLASINTIPASRPPPSNPTGVGNYHTGRIISSGSASLIYASGSGRYQWATGASEATGLPITNAGSANNISWTFSKSGMTLAPTTTASQEHPKTSRSVHTETLAPTTTPTPTGTETKRSIHTQTPTTTEYAHTTGNESSTSTGFSTHVDTSGLPLTSAASHASIGSTAKSSGPSAFTGVADKTLNVPFAWSSILMLAGMALSIS